MREAILLDGDNLASEIRARLSDEVAALKARGVMPCLATILVGNNPASQSYVARKHADCQALGIEAREIRLPAESSADVLDRAIAALNHDPAVHGFLVQLPLPDALDDAHFVARINPRKDIDGLHPENLGRLVGGAPFLLPCTPAGILALLRHYDVPLAGRKVVIIGRGTLVGRPLSLLLGMKGVDATVTLAHSQTPDLHRLTPQADIVIAAAGVRDLITADMVRPGAAVVGVGISYDGDAMISDIAADIRAVAGWVTPHHGSVGALTRAMLLTNLVKLAQHAPAA